MYRIAPATPVRSRAAISSERRCWCTQRRLSMVGDPNFSAKAIPLTGLMR